MANRDSYFNKLKEIADSLETVYELDKTNQLDVCYAKLDIKTVVNYASQCASTLSKEQLYERNSESGKYVVLLTYVIMRLEFYQKYELSYENYPYVDTIAEILLKFTRIDLLTREAMQDLNKIVAILKEIDSKFVKFRFSLSYRYLRLFIVMILHKNYWNASVIAKLLLAQMIVKEG